MNSNPKIGQYFKHIYSDSIYRITKITECNKKYNNNKTISYCGDNYTTTGTMLASLLDKEYHLLSKIGELLYL